MTAKLIEPGTQPGERREISINKEEFLIGRGDDCDLRLRVSDISRHHCLLRLRGDEATVADLGSSNGTFVNGQRIRSQASLHSGDELRLGTYRFLVVLGKDDGLSWCPDGVTTSSDATYKLQRVKGQPPPAENERGHPPGEAGGQGESTG